MASFFKKKGGEEEKKMEETSSDIIIAGLSDLRELHRQKSVVSVAAILLIGVRDTDLEDAAEILQNIMNVKILNLSRTPIQSLKIFATVSYNITVLDLSNTRITQKQVNFVASVTSLRDLQVGGNRNIQNISFVATLRKLETLGIPFTGVGDISTTLKLTNLQFLDISGNKLDEGAIKVINKLYRLRELDVSFSSLDITALDNVVFARLFRVTYSIKKGECRVYYPSSAISDVDEKLSIGMRFQKTNEIENFTIRIRKKTKSHPHFGKGSPAAFMVMEMGESEFGKPLQLIHGKMYIFRVYQHRHIDDPSREHPFYIDYNIGGGPANNDDGKVAPEDERGVVSGELYFQPDIRDGKTLYAECANHLFMGFPIKIEVRLYESTSNEMCALCETEVEDVSQMYGCGECKNIWYCSEKCALEDQENHECEI